MGFRPKTFKVYNMIGKTHYALDSDHATFCGRQVDDFTFKKDVSNNIGIDSPHLCIKCKQVALS